MTAPDTSVVSGTLVKISWTAPSTDNNYSVTAYKILIGDSSNSFTEDTSICDGSDSTTMTNMFCWVSMETLAAAPYSLAFQSVIKVKAQALNARGYSEVSDPSSGATMAQSPDAMTDPRAGSATSISQIQVEWDALISPDNGDSTILSYSLEWDEGTNGVSWTVLVGLSTASTATTYTLSSGVTTGDEYLFRVRARNAFGWGSYSSEVTLKAAEKPD